ncbi:DUF916 domain-containing protein [Patescibacteria group bacterium]|nr:DUF916 domain-containing protein [Patescibacteria group bacterium]
MNKIWKSLIVLGLLLMPANVLAAEDGQMAIYPQNWDGSNELTKHWFIYNLANGATHQDTVVIENMGDSDLSVKIYAVDALTTTEGAFALENEEEEKNDVGAWVNVEGSELDLGPREKGTVNFSITIPEDASPGEHMGGIVVENKKIKEGELLNLKTRVGVRMIETVPGEIVKKVNIGDINVEGFFASIWSLFYDYHFDYKLINEGNVQISPKSEVSLDSNWFGNVASATKEVNGSIFPQKDVAQQLDIDETLYFGPYTLTITASAQEDMVPVQKSHTFWVLPWKILLAMAVVLIAGISWRYSHQEGKESKSRAFKKKVKKKESTAKKKLKKTTRK